MYRFCRFCTSVLTLYGTEMFSVMSSGRPMVISSGMQSMEIMRNVYQTVKKHNSAFTFLQCTSAYPLPMEHVNLRIITVRLSHSGTPVHFSTKMITCKWHLHCEWVPQGFFWFQKKVINKGLTFNHPKNPRRTLQQKVSQRVVLGKKEQKYLTSSTSTTTTSTPYSVKEVYCFIKCFN